MAFWIITTHFRPEGKLLVIMTLIEEVVYMSLIGASLAITIGYCVGMNRNNHGNGYGRWNGWNGWNNRGEPYHAGNQQDVWEDNNWDRHEVQLLPGAAAARLRATNLVWTFSRAADRYVLRPLQTLVGAEHHRFQIYQWSDTNDCYWQCSSGDDLEALEGSREYLAWLERQEGIEAANEANSYPHDVEAGVHPPDDDGTQQAAAADEWASNGDDEHLVKREQDEIVDRNPAPKAPPRQILSNPKPKAAPRARSSLFRGNPSMAVVAKHPDHFYNGRGRRGSA